MAITLSHKAGPHHELCTHHLGGGDEYAPQDAGTCFHAVSMTDDAEVEVELTRTPRVHVYARDEAGMTAPAARRLAARISHAADVLDGLPLMLEELQHTPLVADESPSRAGILGSPHAKRGPLSAAALRLRWRPNRTR